MSATTGSLQGAASHDEGLVEMDAEKPRVEVPLFLVYCPPAAQLFRAPSGEERFYNDTVHAYLNWQGPPTASAAAVATPSRFDCKLPTITVPSDIRGGELSEEDKENVHRALEHHSSAWGQERFEEARANVTFKLCRFGDAADPMLRVEGEAGAVLRVETKDAEFFKEVAIDPSGHGKACVDFGNRHSSACAVPFVLPFVLETAAEDVNRTLTAEHVNRRTGKAKRRTKSWDTLALFLSRLPEDSLVHKVISREWSRILGAEQFITPFAPAEWPEEAPFCGMFTFGRVTIGERDERIAVALAIRRVSGKLSTPGGRRHVDQSAYDSAVAEFQEEVGGSYELQKAMEETAPWPATPESTLFYFDVGRTYNDPERAASVDEFRRLTVGRLPSTLGYDSLGRAVILLPVQRDDEHLRRLLSLSSRESEKGQQGEWTEFWNHIYRDGGGGERRRTPRQAVNPFGNATPVDTAATERGILEARQARGE